MSNCFIIISHHRSGSNFLCNLLCANKEVMCLNEPLSMHTSFFKEKDLISWGENEYNSVFLHDSLRNNNALIEYLKELKKYLVEESNENRPVGFKETLLFAKMPWLKQFIPELKIIYLVRDPRAVVNSVKRNDMYKIWNYEVVIKRYLKRNDKKIDFSNPTELATWSWKIRDELFNKYKDLFIHKIVRLEDVVNNPLKEANSIMNFLNKDLSNEQKDFLSKVYGDTKKGKAFSVFTTKDRVLKEWKGKMSFDEKQYIEQTLYYEMEKYKYL